MAGQLLILSMMIVTTTCFLIGVTARYWLVDWMMRTGMASVLVVELLFLAMICRDIIRKDTPGEDAWPITSQ
jgi:hypothetical protein